MYRLAYIWGSGKISALKHCVPASRLTSASRIIDTINAAQDNRGKFYPRLAWLCPGHRLNPTPFDEAYAHLGNQIEQK